MDENAKELTKRSGERFSGRSQLDSLRQEIALNFAPHLAEWTDTLILGEDYASHLVDGTPLIIARDFVNQIGAMLRPKGKQWFHHRVAISEDANNDTGIREYLDWRTKQMHRIMTDRVTGFESAAKQTDLFYGLFGDACMSIDVSAEQDSLRFCVHHTKDVVWDIGPDNDVDTITRREKWTPRIIIAKFGPENVDSKIKDAATKSPNTTFDIEHHVLPGDEYEPYSKKFKSRNAGGLQSKFASVWIDVTHAKVMRETPQPTRRYVIPIGERMFGAPYGISLATMIALPDARLIQQQALALLEAAEKSANPPLIAYEDAIRGLPDIRAGGITWAEKTYDSRTGQPVTPLDMGKNFPLAVDTLMRTEHQLTRSFYLDVLRLPDTRGSKSVEEIQFLIDEYVRSALPLFAPMHDAYNNAMLHEVDAIIELTGGYDEKEKPEELTPEIMTFAWDNPLSEMQDRAKAVRVGEVAQLVQTIAGIEAAAAETEGVQRGNPEKMFHDAMIGLNAAEWLLTEEEADEKKKALAEKRQQQEALAQAEGIAPVIDSGVNAAKAVSEIGAMAPPGFAVPVQ